jgi:hypothetical protein
MVDTLSRHSRTSGILLQTKKDSGQARMTKKQNKHLKSIIKQKSGLTHSFVRRLKNILK